MYINWIEVNNFRLLKPQKVEFNNRISIITGLNGQGKTSVLEAIYFLSQAKSFRTSKSKDVIKWGNSQGLLSIIGKINTEFGSKKIAYKVIEGKKIIEINSKTIRKPIDFYGQFSVIEITPSDAELVYGSSQIRRKFIDRLLTMSQPSYVEILLDYQRALKNRNSILIKTNNILSLTQKDTILRNVSMWNEVLIKEGLELCRQRKNFLSIFKPFFIKCYCNIAGIDNPEKVSLKYKSQFLHDEEVSNVEDIRVEYAKRFDKDMRQKTTTFGVHRDDIQIFLESGFGYNEARYGASQGQIKNISLALKFAANEYFVQSGKESPVLLLDDIESELDENRRKYLFELLSSIKNQVIIATTGLSNTVKKSLETSSFFIAKNGEIMPEN